MYCTLEGRNVEVRKAKEMLGGHNQEREELIESAMDLFTKERMKNNESPRRVTMYPDEFPPVVKADSSEYLIKELGLEKIEDSFLSSKDNLFKLTQTDNIQKAAEKLNDVFRDKLIKVTECGDSCILTIENKPNTRFKQINEIYDGLKNPKTILNLINRLVNYHGIDINLISNVELSKSDWKDVVNATTTKGFIKDGKIYINSDNCTIDTKVHELMHLFLGGIRYIDPQLYFDTINKISGNPELEVRIREFSHRSDSDALEEVLVDEYSKYLTGQDSLINNLSEDIIYDLNYNIHRMLDTMFMGDYSSKIVPDQDLPFMSMFKLGKLLNSQYIYSNLFNASTMHRKTQNIKQELLKSGEIIKEC